MWRSWWRRFGSRSGRARRNVLRVASANLFAQGLTLALSPILTRMFGPAEFGVLGSFTACALILSSVCTLRADWLIGGGAGRRRAEILTAGMFWYALAVCSAALVGVLAWRGSTAACEAAALCSVLPLAPGVALLMSWTTLAASWSVRNGDLRPVSRSRLVQSLATSGSMLATGSLRYGTLGLIGSTALGAALGFGALIQGVRLRCQVAPRHAIRLMRCVAVRFGRRLRVAGTTCVVNAVGLYIAPLAMVWAYGAYEAGAFVVAQRIAIAPIQAVTGAISLAFMAEAGDRLRKGRTGLDRLLASATRKLGVIAGLATIVSAPAPMYASHLLGGASWHDVGWVVVSLIPLLATQIMVSPTAPLLTLLGRESWVLRWDIGRVVLLLSWFLVAHQMEAPMLVSVIGYSIIIASMYLVLFFRLWKSCRETAHPGVQDREFDKM